MKIIDGGVCAPIGFTANGINAGIKPGRTKPDLGLIYSDTPAAAAAAYTTNLVQGAPITVTRNNLEDGIAQAVIFNSGNANTCNADGIEIAEAMCSLLADEMGIKAKDVIVASTGVIGQRLKIDPIAAGMHALCNGLSRDGSDSAATAVMTTDTVKKEIAVEFDLGGKTCRLAGIAKGSGMIHPNMATMLAFLTSDVSITSGMLKKALSEDIEDSFNMISVDGDTSTNDMVSIMANGMAGNETIDCEGEDYIVFTKALSTVTTYLARNMAKDGEGASKLIICTVSGATDTKTAKTVAKSVICSNLLKCAIFGSDANWGRVLCAIGYSGADVDISKIDVSFKSATGEIQVCENGAGIDFSEEKAKQILDEKEIDILVSVGDGNLGATAYGCDLTYEYVNINGSYRS